MIEIKDLDGDVITSGDNIRSILMNATSPNIRTRISFKRADLRNMDLSDVVICASTDASSSRRSDFMGADFSGSNMMGAQLAGLDLRGCNFTDCDFRNLSMSMCDLTGARFHNVDAGAYTENQTGYSTWITRTIFDRVCVTECDFEQAMLSADSAYSAIFKDCNFEDANFNSTWNGAAFYNCDMEDCNPGNPLPGGEGAKFGVSIYQCNMRDVSLKGCPDTPTEITSDVTVTWQSSWIGEDDHWDTKRKIAQTDARNRAMNLYAAIQAQYQAEADAKAAKRKAKMDALIAKEQQYEQAYQARQAKAELARMAADKARQEVAAEVKTSTLPPLTGEFEIAHTAFTGRVYRVRIKFNRTLRVGWRTVRDQGFTVSKGTVTNARRVNKRSDFWELDIKPYGSGNVTITTTSALLGQGGYSLANNASVTIIR